MKAQGENEMKNTKKEMTAEFKKRYAEVSAKAKAVKAKLEEAAVNRMIKRGYVVYKNDEEEESEESDEVESEDLD